MKNAGFDCDELRKTGVAVKAPGPLYIEDGVVPSFATPSGKVELYSKQLEAAGFDVNFSGDYEAGTDLLLENWTIYAYNDDGTTPGELDASDTLATSTTTNASTAPPASPLNCSTRREDRSDKRPQI